MKRTLDNCSLVKKYGRPEQRFGKCLGFAISEFDDEPCDTCKDCKLCESYDDYEENWKDD